MAARSLCTSHLSTYASVIAPWHAQHSTDSAHCTRCCLPCPARPPSDLQEAWTFKAGELVRLEGSVLDLLTQSGATWMAMTRLRDLHAYDPHVSLHEHACG